MGLGPAVDLRRYQNTAISPYPKWKRVRFLFARLDTKEMLSGQIVLPVIISLIAYLQEVAVTEDGLSSQHGVKM